MKDKRSLLILNVQNIVFNDINICVFEIFLNVLNRAYHVSNHFYVLSSSVSFHHCLNILVESLAFFITNMTEIFRKSIQVAVEKLHFDTHTDIKNPEIFKHVVYNFFVVVSSIDSKKVLNNLDK